MVIWYGTNDVTLILNVGKWLLLLTDINDDSIDMQFR